MTARATFAADLSAGLTRTQIAAKHGVSRQYVSRVLLSPEAPRPRGRRPKSVVTCAACGGRGVVDAKGGE